MQEPPHSCPEIDEAIRVLEELVTRGGALEATRKINADLRDYANHWKEVAEELENEKSSLQERVEELEDEIAELKKELRQYESLSIQTG